jgi:hypothetical protein
MSNVRFQIMIGGKKGLECMNDAFNRFSSTFKNTKICVKQNFIFSLFSFFLFLMICIEWMWIVSTLKCTWRVSCDFIMSFADSCLFTFLISIENFFYENKIAHFFTTSFWIIRNKMNRCYHLKRKLLFWTFIKNLKQQNSSDFRTSCLSL